MPSEPNRENIEISTEGVESEISVLGAMMLEPNACIDDVRATLGAFPPLCFTSDDRRFVWRAVNDLYAGGEPIDILTVEARMLALGCEHELDYKRDLLLDMVSSVTSAANAQYHARIVREEHQRRLAVREAYTLQSQAYDRTLNPVELIGKASTRLALIADTRTSVPAVASELCTTYVESLRSDQPENIVPTGFAGLDDMLGGGLRGGDVVIVAACTGIGKSALALQISLHATAHVPVWFASLEMSREQLSQRILALQSDVFAGKFRSRLSASHMSTDDWYRLENASVPDTLHIEVQPGMSGTEFRSKARLMHRRARIGLAVVDYLQLMSGPGDNQNIKLEDLCKDVKATALELNIPVLLLSQVNRSPSRENKAPRLCDLRSSGGIEQTGDEVLILHTSESRSREHFDPTRKYRYQLLIEKQRQGPVGKLDLEFQPSLTRFSEPSESAAIE